MKQSFTVRRGALDRVEAFLPGLFVLYVKLERQVVGVLRLEMAPSSKERRKAASAGRPTSLRLRRNVKLGEEPGDGLEATLVGECRKIDTFH